MSPNDRNRGRDDEENWGMREGGKNRMQKVTKDMLSLSEKMVFAQIICCHPDAKWLPRFDTKLWGCAPLIHVHKRLSVLCKCLCFFAKKKKKEPAANIHKNPNKLRRCLRKLCTNSFSKNQLPHNINENTAHAARIQKSLGWKTGLYKVEWHLQLGSAENWGRHEGLWGWVGGGEEGVYLQRNFTSMWSLSGLSMYDCLNNPAPGQRGLQENSAEFMSEAKNRNSPTSSQWLQSDHHGDPNYRNQAGPFSRTIPWLSATLGIVGLYLDAFLGEGMSNWQTEPDPLKKKKSTGKEEF